MQEYFHIGYTIVSLIFVSICVGQSSSPALPQCPLETEATGLITGFFIAAGLNVWLEDRFGFGKASQ